MNIAPSVRSATLQPSLSLETFQTAIQHEFCIGSGIDADLFSANVNVCSDLDINFAGDPITPIHDALQWRYSRFGLKAKGTLYAALLLQEDGECWQAKLSQARMDPKKGKAIKYETPKNGGSRVYLPTIPPIIRRRIEERYSVYIPASGSFWSWVEAHPEIPITWTEGGKKALALLSQGYVAIALIGVNGGYRKLVDGVRALTPDVARFAQPNRLHILAFDEDEHGQTRQRVDIALSRFGGLLASSGNVAIASWEGHQGKGIDDLLVNAGAESVHNAIASALPLKDWALLRRLQRRLSWPENLKADSRDISTIDLEQMPERGIIALAAPKGTGKTKLLSRLVDIEIGAIAPSHRVALSRNFCHRLGLDYRGDIAGAKKTGVVEGGIYRVGVGLCVDALLSINPEQFEGRDLFIDEVVQVLRHLLTSSTCARDGKRPALLSRFHELVRVARRIFVADADLDNATLHYLRQLRGDEAPIYLIRNGYQGEGYPVEFIQAPDRTAITHQLLSDANTLPSGKVLLVATDSKASSKAIARLIQHHNSSLRVLVINSETSGGQDEREFIECPDTVLSRGDYDVVIASPSMATGVSIEVQDIIKRVYGIFTGVSSTDADMAQALGRVRQPVERVVWCARVGSNYSKISRSTNPLEIKQHLMSKTSATISLVRSSLKEDTADTISAYDWQSDPHLNLFVRIEAERNHSMHCLRDALRVRLLYEGNQITVKEYDSNAVVKALLKDARDELQRIDAEAIAHAEDLTAAQVIEMEGRDNLSLDDQQAIAKYWLKEFYCIDEVTLEDVLWDNDGRRRAEIASLEHLLYPDIAIDQTVKSIEKQASWNRGNTPWDMSQAALRRTLREELGLKDFLNENRYWIKPDLKPYGDRARQHAHLVKLAFNFTITPQMSDTQIVHQLLSQIGVKVALSWSRSIVGMEGKKCRVYRLEAEHWQRVLSILHRRHARRTTLDQDIASDSGSPPSILCNSSGGDPEAIQIHQGWTELLQEATAYGAEAIQSIISKWKPEELSAVLSGLPENAFEQIVQLYPRIFKHCA